MAAPSFPRHAMKSRFQHVMVFVAAITSPVATAPSALAAQAAAGSQYVLCYSDANASPFYLSSDFKIDVPVAPDAKSPNSDGGASRRALDALAKEFLEYLRADRGYQNSGFYPTTCQGKPSAGELATARDLLHQRFKQLKFVETDWKPGVKPTAKPMASATPSTGASSANATKSGPQSAYEQALAAQRPKSVTQEQLAAAAKKPAPAPYPNRAYPATAPATTSQPSVATTGNLYQFCSSTGSPYRGTAQSHFYVTQVFPASSANLHPEGAFGVYLRKQHPQESNYASCTQPSQLSMLENTRRTNIEYSRKNFPERAVVELNWKPAN